MLIFIAIINKPLLEPEHNSSVKYDIRFSTCYTFDRINQSVMYPNFRFMLVFNHIAK